MKQIKRIDPSSKAFIAWLYFIAIVFLFLFYSLLGRSVSIDNTYKFTQKLQSVSYAPFKNSESPMDFAKGFVIPEDRIDKDLELLSKHFQAIRIYSVSGLESVPKYAKKHGLKVLLGVWVCADEEMTKQELQTMLKLTKEYPDVISAVVVGNEVLLRREMSGDKLGSYIKWVKENVSDIPVTYADVWEFWLKNQNLAPLVDFVTIHILPYWEDNPVSIDVALEHIQTTHMEVSNTLKEKKILIGETGWPSEGRMRGASIPSPVAQAEFIRGFLKIADENNWNYNIIEAFDQPWKRASEGAVGGYWGIFDTNSTDKNVIWGEVSEFTNYYWLFTVCVIIFLSSLVFIYKVKSNDILLILKAIMFSFVGAILITQQFNQYMITSKDIIDYTRSIVFALFLILLYFGVIESFVKTLDKKKLFEFVRPSIIVLVVVESLYLFLDGRYRSFQNYAIIFSTISFCVLYFHKNLLNMNFVSFEKLSVILIIISGLGILYIEGIENWQAIIWVATSFVFSFVVYITTKEGSLKIFYPYIIFVFLIGVVIYFIRQNIFINSEYILICENNPNKLVCNIRTILGYMVYNQYLGLIALISGILFLIFRYKFLLYCSLVTSLVAIFFFNSSIGVIVLVLTFFVIPVFDNVNKLYYK
ncbi:hypothetical protein [Arcobacter sp. FWKO B]|uniref:glycoside hydrolase family 17 protein n=1 Tax=Arcobacter sp. FWKO B TaxID=2593672 RepID=UPI0018A584FE|nr:hypothetical protein [Arcobacter sp. FWKO B]QOG11682.1 beta (1-6) glucans synthase [Arcobacter sp. FWKO B]